MYIDRMDTGEDLDEEQYLRSCFHAIIDDRVWVIGSYGQLNAVFSMNKEMRDLRLAYDATVQECLTQEQRNQELYGCIGKKNHHIYLFPIMGLGIIDIDVISGRQKRYNLKEWCKIDGPFYEPMDVKEYKGCFYLIPGYVQYPLLKFDGAVVEECSGWKEQVQEITGRKSGVLAFQCVLLANKLYTLLHGSNKILCTDMETLEINTYDLPPQGYSFERLHYHNGKFWLIPGGRGEILSFSIEHGIEERFTIPDTFICSECHTFTNSFFYDNTMWIIPWMAKEILVLDLLSGCIEVLKFPEIMREQPFATDIPNVEAGFEDGHYLKLLACGGRYHCIIDMKDRKFVEVIDSHVPEECLRNNPDEISGRLNIWSRKYGTLDDFIAKVVQDTGTG